MDRQSSNARTRASYSQLGVAAGLTLVALGVLPFARHELGFSGGVLASMVAATVAVNVVAAALLFLQYLNGQPARLGLGTTYVFCAAMAVAYGLGLFTILGVGAGSADLLSLISQTATPVLLSATFLLEGRSARRAVVASKRPWHVFVSVFCVVALVATITYLTSKSAFSATQLGLGLTGAIILLGNVVVRTKTARRSGTERGMALVAFGCLLQWLVAFAGKEPFTLGWYAAHALGLSLAAVVLGMLVVELSQLYRRAEEDKIYLEDMTMELLRDKRRLHSREERVRRIISTAADAYVEVDAEGVISGWNTKAADMFGWTTANSIGQPFANHVASGTDAAELTQLVQEFWSAADRADGRRLELLARNSSGQHFPVEATTWVDDGEDTRTMNFFLRDITTRRLAEERMQKALADERAAVLRLQELDRAKTTFVSSVSHELRSPLTSTLGYLELLLDGDVGEVKAEQARMIEIAARNAKRLQGLIEDLLTLSQIEAGTLNLRFKPVEMKGLLGKTVGNMSLMAVERSVELSLAIDELGMCAGDSDQIARAIGNVVGNAIKFTPPNGWAKVTAVRAGDHVEIVISDNGIGIPAGEQDKLFTQFFRASSAVEQAHHGTGLGLTIAKAIVEHHGGNIALESTVGIGTKVTIGLPCLAVEPPMEAPIP